MGVSILNRAGDRLLAGLRRVSASPCACIITLLVVSGALAVPLCLALLTRMQGVLLFGVLGVLIVYAEWIDGRARNRRRMFLRAAWQGVVPAGGTLAAVALAWIQLGYLDSNGGAFMYTQLADPAALLPAATGGAVDATPEVGVPADVAAAIENYKRAIELHPDFPTAYRMLGYAYFQTNQLDAAIAAYEKAVELSPDYVDAHNGLAMLYFQSGQLDKAAAQQEKVKALGAGASGHSVEGMLPPGHPPMGATPGATERRSELPEGHPPIR
ncbi:tetratricopeptide repeat protein [bacterium]|nr:tetratricopeptide repeat protein [bacterium]